MQRDDYMDQSKKKQNKIVLLVSFVLIKISLNESNITIKQRDFFHVTIKCLFKPSIGRGAYFSISVTILWFLNSYVFQDIIYINIYTYIDTQSSFNSCRVLIPKYSSLTPYQNPQMFKSLMAQYLHITYIHTPIYFKSSLDYL